MKKAVVLFLVVFSITSSTQELMKRDNKSLSDMENAISVTIGGTFIVNGSFPASPFERVDQFITRIYNLYKGENLGALSEIDDLELINQKLDNYARRNITLKRTSEDLILDLEKFRLTGDFNYNPYLKNDDVLIFPALDMDRSFFNIDGAVNNPTKVQYVDGDKLSDAIIMAQGINRSYQNINQAEITRLSYDGTSEEILNVNIVDDIPLQRGDRIRILAEETNRKDYKVLVLGEVNRPGFISITINSTSLNDVINKAGGFKTSADLNLAELIKVNDPYKYYKQRMFTRNYNQNIELDEKYDMALYNIFDNKLVDNMLMQRAGNVSLEDSLLFVFDNNLRQWKQESMIDFSNLKNNNSKEGKYIVEDGDMIIVPRKSSSVYVFGQVAKTGYQPFIEGKKVEFYIEQAGGLAINAKDLGEAVLIKGKSRNWINIYDDRAIVESGDFVWVPKEERKDFLYYLNRISPIVTIISTAATITFLVIQLGK